MNVQPTNEIRELTAARLNEVTGAGFLDNLGILNDWYDLYKNWYGKVENQVPDISQVL